MSCSAIEVENVSKRYVIRHEATPDSLRDAVQSQSRRLWHRLRYRARMTNEEFWALRDLSFAVRPGEVVGMIGRNGAGKSTLLKVLSRITEPTSGRVQLRGRVASLLEVGTGFHGELSGRVIIYLNGSILGLKRAEIRRRFDEIVAFSEVERFLDTPVKRYSSGMYVRLAFAVAAHLEPEILIIDEVLAVGDVAFQKKCIGKINSVAREDGRTVLFVSHNMIAVQSLCQRAIMLQGGRIVFDGRVAEGVARYLKAEGNTNSSIRWSDPATAPGSESMRIFGVAVRPSPSTATGEDELITMQTKIAVKTDFEVLRNDRLLHLTYHLSNENGIVVLTSGSGARHFEAGRHAAEMTIPGGLLNSGTYQLKLLVVEEGSRVTHERDNIVAFAVADHSERRHGWHGREPGVVQPKLDWTLKPVST